MPDFEQADNLTENAVGSEHSWQALPNPPVPAPPSSPTQTESAKTGADEEKNLTVEQGAAPEAETNSEAGEASDSGQRAAGDPVQVMEAVEEASNGQPTETIKRGTGRHAGRLVTGPIPVPEESPQPLPLDITAVQTSDSSVAREEDESRVERKSILRPTTTGAIPLVKPETDRTAQPTAVFDPLADSE